MGDGGQFCDFGGGEEQAAGVGGQACGLGFGLTWEQAFFISVAEDVLDDGVDIGGLGPAHGEGAGVESLWVDDLEVKSAGTFFAGGDGAAAEGRQASADEGGDEFIDEGEAVAFMGAEGEQGGGGVRVGGGLALGVDGGVDGELFSFAFALLDASHGDGAGGPIDDEGKPECFGGGKPPGVRVGAEGGEGSLERDDFGEGGGAIGIGDVAAFGGFHDISAAPQVMESMIHADLGDAEGVGQPHGFLHGGEGGGRAEFALGIPNPAGGKFPGRSDIADHGSGHASAGFGTKKVIEMQRFDGVVRFDAVSGGQFAEAGGILGLAVGKAPLLIGGTNKGVVQRGRNDVHEGKRVGDGWGAGRSKIINKSK